MKIVIFTEEYFYVSNGLWNASFNLHNELNRIGHESFIAVNKQHWIKNFLLEEELSEQAIMRFGSDQINAEGLRLSPFPVLHSLLYYLSKILNLFFLLIHLPLDIHRLCRLKPDMLIIQSGGFPNGLVVKYFLFIGFLCMVKSRIFVINSYPQVISRFSRLYFPILFKLIKYLTNYIVTVSQDVKSDILTFSANLNVIVIYNGVVRKNDNEILKVKTRNSRLLRIGYLGAIIPEKGLHILLDAVVYSNEHLEIVIGGVPKSNSPYFKSISKQIRLLGGNPDIKIDLLGKIDDIKTFFNSIDLLVVPSHREAFGLVAIESLAFGVPVICSNLGGTKEAIENEVTGLYFESGNPYSLYKILRRISLDNALLKSLSQNSIGSVSRWSIEKTAQSFIHLKTIE
jgi:glycosyltransferase involved in cell wall biosynthesis